MKPALVILLAIGWVASAADPPAPSPLEAAKLRQLLT
jgi:hypothetical protein